MQENWSPGDILPWLDTDRGFFAPEQVMQRFNSGSAEVLLGFTREEIEKWVENKFRVLEVGVTSGVGLSQLLEKGVDAYGIEPGLQFSEGKLNYLTKYAQLGIIDRVSDVFANQLATEQGYDVIFANGPNFQSYATSSENFVSSLRALISALSNNDQAYVTFSVSQSDETYHVFIIHSNQSFNLSKFLEDQQIKFEVLFPGGTNNRTQKPVVRIYRLNERGEDASEKMPSNFDLKEYDLDRETTK